MSAETANELRDFHRFLGDRVDQGEMTLTPEEALDEWRALHPDPTEVAAIQEAIDDLENGDAGKPLEDFDREFRARHNLSPS